MSTFIDHEPSSLNASSSDDERADCAPLTAQDAIFPPEKDEPPTKSIRSHSKAEQTDELFQSMVAQTTDAQPTIKASRPAPPKMRKGARRPRSNN